MVEMNNASLKEVFFIFLSFFCVFLCFFVFFAIFSIIFSIFSRCFSTFSTFSFNPLIIGLKNFRHKTIYLQSHPAGLPEGGPVREEEEAHKKEQQPAGQNTLQRGQRGEERREK